MEKKPGIDDELLPHLLLLDSVDRCAAAYATNHRLITHNASKELISFALANTEKMEWWDEDKRDQGGPPRPLLPYWSTHATRNRCHLIWIAHGDGSDAYKASIPRR